MMEMSGIARSFFNLLDKEIGPFDRPFHFHPFPFELGGALNLLTVGSGCQRFVTYVSWDLLGQERQQCNSLGRYELLSICDDYKWCVKILTNIGRQSLSEVFQPGDSLDIGAWSEKGASIQGVAFEKALSMDFPKESVLQRCGLLRCIGITRSEMEWAAKHGTESLFEQLRSAGVYPRTVIARESTIS